MLIRGGFTGESSFVIATNCKKSSGAIVQRRNLTKKFATTYQSIVTMPALNRATTANSGIPRKNEEMCLLGFW